MSFGRPTAPERARSAFVGRVPELAALRAALAEAPRLVVVEGEPGIGKTMLVERFLEEVGARARVLRASAVESESDLVFGVAEQLLGPAESGVHHLAVGARLLELFGEAAPAVVMLDDAQWADQASLSALLFTLRRLAAEPVLVVLTVRTGELPEGLGKIAHGRLGEFLRPAALDDGEVQRLAEALGLTLPARAASRLRRHTGGIPLHARALLEELPAESWHDPEADLPAPRPYAAIVARRLAACSDPARGLVEAVAVLGPTSLAAAAELTAAAGLGARARSPPRRPGHRGRSAFDALEEAVDAGLLRWDGRDGVRFPHPLTAASVLAALGAGRRARAHRAAAALATDDATALRHRPRPPRPAGRGLGRGLRGLRRARGRAAAGGGDRADHREPAERHARLA